MTEYLPILVFLILAFGISIGAIFSSLVVGERNAYADKNSTYECGFDPYEDSRNKFDVRFYLIAILFILFDLEAMFLFPWAISLGHITSMGFWTMCDFLIELTIGFVYAWKIGALEWE